MLVRRANKEDPDQTSLVWVCTVCLGSFGRQLVFIIFRTFTVYTQKNYLKETQNKCLNSQIRSNKKIPVFRVTRPYLNLLMSRFFSGFLEKK